MALSPELLKSAIGSGLLSFPVTHFTDEGAFASGQYKAHRRSRRPSCGPVRRRRNRRVLFPRSRRIRRRHRRCGRIGPGAAAGRRRRRLRRGAGDRIRQAGGEGRRGWNSPLAEYLIQAEQEGLYRHVAAICRAVGIGAIVYHRDDCLFELDTVRRLADACPNLIGFKDGHGNVEQLACLRVALGERLVHIGGMPTAEVFAAAYGAIGVSTYSSAIFNFAPEYAHRFFAAIGSGDCEFTG